MENEVLRRMGRPPMPRSVHKATWGRSLWEAIPDRSPGIDVAAYRRQYPPVIAEYVRTGRLDTIPEENYAALQILKKQGKQLTILTSRSHEEAGHLMADGHRLNHHVVKFYYRDTMQFHKPDPRAFTEVLRDCRVAPNEAVYVGDSVSDAQASLTAGLHFIASLESGLRRKQDFKGYNVSAFIRRFPEVVAAVNGL